MNFTEYQVNTQRTCPSLGSKEVDHAHMIYGMISEIEELDAAIAKGDEVNVGEEITDIHWYNSNYARMNQIEYDTLRLYHFNINPGEDLLKTLVINLSILCDKEKRELAYKKHFDRETKIKLVASIFHTLNALYSQYNLDTNKCMQNNIDKLRKRYPEKFNTTDALNRDLNAERKELEK